MRRSTLTAPAARPRTRVRMSSEPLQSWTWTYCGQAAKRASIVRASEYATRDTASALKGTSALSSPMRQVFGRRHQLAGCGGILQRAESKSGSGGMQLGGGGCHRNVGERAGLQGIQASNGGRMGVRSPCGNDHLVLRRHDRRYHEAGSSRPGQAFPRTGSGHRTPRSGRQTVRMRARTHS